MLRSSNPVVRLIGLAGWSGSGKTTLLAKLLPVLIARGRSISTLKHAHHEFDVDKPGKDSHTHRLAGAREVLVSSARRWALMHELRDEAEPTLGESSRISRRSISSSSKVSRPSPIRSSRCTAALLVRRFFIRATRTSLRSRATHDRRT